MTVDLALPSQQSTWSKPLDRGKTEKRVEFCTMWLVWGIVRPVSKFKVAN